MSAISYLTVTDNFFGTAFQSPSDFLSAFRKLTLPQMAEYVELQLEYERNAALDISCYEQTQTFYIGKTFDDFRNPNSWHPRFASPTRNIDTNYIIRALTYLPSLSIWLPSSFPPPENTQALFGRDTATAYTAGKSFHLAARVHMLLPLRPFIQDGSLRIVPDALYNIFESGESPQRNILESQAITESGDINTRRILDKVGRSTDLPMSDNLETWFFHNEGWLRYHRPIECLYEDMVAITSIDGHFLSSDKIMHDFVASRYTGQGEVSNENSWLNNDFGLPRIKVGKISDLISIRRQEDAFDLWRTSLSKAIRACEAQIANGNQDTKVLKAIFREELLPISLGLQAKVKTPSLKSLIESSGVSFASGATAAFALSTSPELSIGMGAISTTLKLAYDSFKKSSSSTDKALVRLFAHLRGI